MQCIRRTERTECHFSKFTQFQIAVEYILTTFKECYHATGNQTYCYAKLDVIYLKDCTARFYLYYISLHHIHSDYWHENLQIQLSKVRVCLQHALSDCSSRVINYIVKIFASIIMIDIPDIRNAFDVRLTWGNSIIRCRTTPKIEWVTMPDYEYEDYVPLPHTKTIDYHLEYVHYDEHINPERIDWERHVPRRKFRFTLAPFPTIKEHKKPYSKIYEQVIPIAPTRAIAVVPPVQEVWDYKPITTAKLYVKQPQVQAKQYEVEVVTQKMEYHLSYETGPWIQVTTEVLSIKDIIIQSGGCQPKALECRTVATQQSYNVTGQIVVCDINVGFICHDKDQRFVCNPAFQNICSCYKYEVRIICFDRVVQSRFRPTTVETELVIPEVIKVPKIEVIPLPFTRKVYYPPEPRIFEDWIPPTTFHDIEIPIERRIIQDFLPGQPTKVYRYTVPHEMYHDKVIKVEPKIVRYPVLPKRIEKYFTQTTQTMRYVPKLPRIYVDKRGYITTRKYHWTRSSKGYAERLRNLYTQIVPKPVIHYFKLELPTTKVMDYPPRCHNYGEWICIDKEYAPIDEIVKRSGGCSSLDGLECRTVVTHEDHRIVGQVVTCDIHNGFMCRNSDQRNVCNETITNTCGCYCYEVRIRCCDYYERWTVAPVIDEYFPAKVRLDHKTMLPPKVVMETYPAKPRLYTQRLNPTKSILIHILRPEVNIVQRATQTTAKLFVKQPKPHYMEREIGIPVTKIYKITPAPNIYHLHQGWIVTPKTIHVPKRPLIFIDIYIPRTKIHRYTKAPRIQWFRWTPTTVQDIYVPLTKQVLHHMHPNIPTQVWGYTQHDRFIRKHFAPTKIRYIKIPILEQNFTETQIATTQRWFIPGITRSVIIEWIPLPHTKISYYKPTVHVHFDFKLPTTAKLFVKQPQIESLVHEIPPPPTQVYTPVCPFAGPWIYIEFGCSVSMTIAEILRRSPECNKVIDIQCRTSDDKIDVTAVKQVVTCDIVNGFICRENDQRSVCNKAVTDRCCCNSYKVRVCCESRGWIHQLAPPQPAYDVVPLKKRLYSQVLPPEKPRIAIYRPPGCICVDMTIRIECCKYTEVMHPPKLLIKYPPPTRQMTQRYHPTTVRAFIKMPQVKYHEHEIHVQPQIYHVPPLGCICRNMTISIHCCIYKQHVHPTQVHRVWEKPKVQYIWDTVLLPQTRIWEKRIQPTIRVLKLLPTTVQDIYFPQQKYIIHDDHVNNPPDLIQYPQKIKSYKDHVAPQPTYVRRRTPPVRRYWVNVPHVYDVKFYPIPTEAIAEIPVPHTRIERFTQPEREQECHFPLPKMRTVTSCYRVTRAREVCTPEWLQYWLALVRNCTVERLRRRGCTIEPQLDPDTIRQLQTAAAVCIRIIGDTSCRDDRFSLMKLMFEKEFIIVGRIEEHFHFHPNVSDELKKCVVLINEKKMNSCFPGFHTLLHDLLLHGKMNLTLEIDKYYDPSCLMQQMEHCRPSDLETLEELIYSTFGTCIKLCPSSERGRGCSYDALRFRHCDSVDVRNFIQEVDNCIADSSGQRNFQKLPLRKRIVIVIKCLIKCHPNCIMSNWAVFKEMLSYIIEVFKGGRGSYSEETDYCFGQFTLNNLKPCCQNLLVITSALQDTRTGMNKDAMQSISNCFRRALDACSTDVCEGFLSVLESVCNAAYLTDADKDYSPYSYRSINSVKVFGDELNICESEYQEDIDYDTDSNVTPEDTCIPLHLSENSSSVKYIVQRSCRGYDIGKWLNATKSCMTDETKKIGLKNPDLLTIEKVMKLLRHCISTQDYLKCHPKGRKEYRLLLSSFLNIIRRFSVISNTSTCPQDLIIENIGKCQTSLYSFLILKYESSIMKDRKTAFECLNKSFKNCSSMIVESILKILDDTIYPNNSAPIYSNDYTVCEPDDPAFLNVRNKCELKLLKKGYLGGNDKDKEQNYEIEKFHFGPTPSLLQIKQLNERIGLQSDKIINDSEIRAFPAYNGENSGESITSNSLDFTPMNEVYGIRTPQIEKDSMFYRSAGYCSSYHYEQYFETILNCQSIRMKAIIYYKGTNCEEWMQKWGESLMRCLLEDKEHLLSCQMSDEKQVANYLEVLSEKLDSSRRFIGENCPAIKPCYGANIPHLSSCSSVIYKQLSDKKPAVLTERSLLEILDCLKNVWPYCSNDISLLTLPPIYIPFGIDLKEILKENEDSTCLSAKIRSSDSECTSHQKHSATKEIYDCFDRTIRRINDSLNATTEKLHWHVLPLTVCVMMHPILECKQNNYYEFKEFMKEFLEGIKRKLNTYLNIFDEPSDIQQGKKCIEQFTSPSIDGCLSIMFGYMTSFHKGLAKSSDYPFQCVEDTFKDCGDLNTFHLLMKKSMNVSENDNIKTNEVVIEEEICIKKENYGLGLHSCLFEDFEKSLTPLEKCPLHEEQNSTAHNALKVCKNCILKEVDDMCFYDQHDLANAITSTFKPITKCLKKLKMNDSCIQDLTNAIRNDCISKFNEYTLSIRKGAVLKATQLASEFYQCLKEKITHCPTDIYTAVFNLCNKISGLEIISVFQ